MHLKDEEETLFKLIIRLVEEDKLDEAEETSKKFPFEPDEVEVDAVLSMQ